MPPPTQQLRERSAVLIQHMELVGLTALGHHFIQISQMASTHKPLHLGIPWGTSRDPRHSSELLVSLHRLCMLLVTERVEAYLPEAFTFGQQLLTNAREDTSHFVSTVLALILALRTNRSSLAAAGMFGAGKATAISYLLAWLALTTKDTAITATFRENPAAEAIAQNFDHMHLSKAQLALLVRPVGRKHYNADSPHSIDAPLNKCTPRRRKVPK